MKPVRSDAEDVLKFRYEDSEKNFKFLLACFPARLLNPSFLSFTLVPSCLPFLSSFLPSLSCQCLS
jgi:hypothetical protein